MRPAPHEPRITRLRGGYAVSFFEDGKRRRYSLGTDDWTEANRRFADWQRPVSNAAFNRTMRVYFIQSDGPGGYIKIGIAKDIPTRLSTLQVSTPHLLTLLGTIQGGSAEEADLHTQFAAAHVRGEWFRPVPELMALIAAIPSPPTSRAIDPFEDIGEVWARFLAAGHSVAGGPAQQVNIGE